MSFIERLGKGWHIVLQSLRVLQADKELLVFPILQGLIIISLGALILLPVGFSGAVTESSLIFAIFLFLVSSYFISTFFQAAIVSSASVRFSGKNPSIGEGFKRPLSRLFALFTWAIVTFFVSILIGALRGKKQNGSGIGQETVAGAVKLAWGLLTFYVIPVILFEKLSIFKAIGRSSSLFKKTWGENVTARFTIHTIVSLILIPFILLGIWAVYSQNVQFMIFAGVLFFIVLIIVSVIQSITKGILKAALYEYAIKGKVPKVYSSDTLKSLFE